LARTEKVGSGKQMHDYTKKIIVRFFFISMYVWFAFD